jgi:hypothetical protein
MESEQKVKLYLGVLFLIFSIIYCVLLILEIQHSLSLKSSKSVLELLLQNNILELNGSRVSHFNLTEQN